MADDKEFEQRLARFRKLPMFLRVIVSRPRTFIALAVALVVFFLLPDSRRLVSRALIGWDVFTAVYLLLVYIMVLRSGLSHIKRNAVLEDDGRFLILLVASLGAFASIGVQQPANLTVVVIDNERYGETGMQHTHTAYGVDLAAIASACKFKHSITAKSDVAKVRELAYQTPGPNFAAVKVLDEKLPLVLPPQDGVVLKDRFRKAVLGR